MWSFKNYRCRLSSIIINPQVYEVKSERCLSRNTMGPSHRSYSDRQWKLEIERRTAATTPIRLTRTEDTWTKNLNNSGARQLKRYDPAGRVINGATWRSWRMRKRHSDPVKINMLEWFRWTSRSSLYGKPRGEIDNSKNLKICRKPCWILNAWPEKEPMRLTSTRAEPLKFCKVDFTRTMVAVL